MLSPEEVKTEVVVKTEFDPELSLDSEMAYAESSAAEESPVKKEPIKPCSIRLLRDRDIDQRLRKKCKKNEAGILSMCILYYVGHCNNRIYWPRDLISQYVCAF